MGNQLGGAVRIAAAAPGRARLGLVADYLEAQCRALGVTLKQESVTDAHAKTADVVVRCTGAVPVRRRFVEWAPDARPVTPRDVLAGKIKKPEKARAIVLDEDGGHAAMGAAEWLCDNGWDVTVVTGDMFVGQRLTSTMELTPYNQRAAAKKITFRPQLDVVKVTANAVETVDMFSRAPVRLEAELIVDASYEVPQPVTNPSATELPSAGDAVAPRRIGQAILEGHRLGRSL